MLSIFTLGACGLRVEFVVAIDKTRVRVPAGAVPLFYNGREKIIEDGKEMLSNEYNKCY